MKNCTALSRIIQVEQSSSHPIIALKNMNNHKAARNASNGASKNSMQGTQHRTKTQPNHATDGSVIGICCDVLTLDNLDTYKTKIKKTKKNTTLKHKFDFVNVNLNNYCEKIYYMSKDGIVL